MILRPMSGFAAMALAVTMTFAAPSQAEPLQLSKFMKPSVAKSAVSKPVAAQRTAAKPRVAAKQSTAHRVIAAKKPVARRPAALAQRRAPAVAAVVPEPAHTEAAEAFAAQPLVQVVSADELNDLDRAAGAPTTDGSGRRVQLVEATDYNAIDAAAPTEAAAASNVPAKEEEARIDPPAQGWFERLWAAVNGAFVRLASALRSVVG